MFKFLGVVAVLAMGASPALAQSGAPTPADATQIPSPDPALPPVPQSTLGGPMTTTGAPPAGTTDPSLGMTAPPPQKPAKKEPGRGDFDAGGQARFPSGPDETGGNYKSFNWVAVDLKGRYFLLDSVTLNGNIPLAVKKPENLMTDGATVDPRMIGGMTVRLDAKVPVPKMPIIKYDTEIGLSLTGAYMREGAMLLSDKDFPLFTGDMKPGFAGALITKVKLSSLLDFSLLPAWVYQSGTMNSHKAVQVPMSLIVKLGEVVKVNADLGVYTGDDYSFSGDEGGRIYAGGALDLKIGPILAHAGAGVASLLTGGAYPTISDSIYVDLNVKYAK